MATYQHVLPGMGADAANRFAALLATHRGNNADRKHASPDSVIHYAIPLR